ncbi:hypothetical protein E1193_10285 [Micromonospora sp. KC606]|uniref:hypothetical protein n=1 Tax=Micromonospora sp. KC606 TaxID=2530379 RepID=UPI0010527C00|nr:hypothetical protein [Micromonospora sp. KC606]TDC82941.1 hypothetical protein E1193_10285 [Micromonospora sp. KC606]
MESQLIVLVPIAVVWLAAGIVADGLPRLDRARALRRRTGWLLALTVTGLSMTAAVLLTDLASTGDTPADRAAAGLTLVAVPGVVVAACAVRRARRLRSGARALATASGTPAPYGLRATAAHPLIALPVQVTALATVPPVLSTVGVDLTAGPGLTGPAITVGGIVVIAIGVRHALRHSRLAERALPPATGLTGTPVSARPAGALHV